jgi:hypothetical protein
LKVFAKQENQKDVSLTTTKKDFKKLVLLNKQIRSMVWTDEEAAIKPRCLAAPNDWKVSTCEVMK